MMTQEQKHKVLVDARNLIDKYGLAKGRLRDRYTGGYCTRGAIYYSIEQWSNGAFSGWTLLYEAENVLREVLGQETISLPFNPSCMHTLDVDKQIPDWNNAPQRTKEEVLEVFDKAIAKTAPEPYPPYISIPEVEKEEVLVTA